MTHTNATQHRSRVVVFLFGLAILHGSVINLMPVMFSTMGETFGLGKAHQALLKSCFFGGSVAALVVAGYLTQYLGVRRMSIILGTVTGLGALMFGLAPTYPLVLTSACLLGMGVNPLAAVYAAIIAEFFVDIRQRMYMWTYAVMAASATVATYVLGRLLDALSGYNVIFIGLGMSIWLWFTILLVVAWREIAPAARIPSTRRLEHPHSVSLGEKLVVVGRFITAGIFTQAALYIMCLLMILDYLCVSNMLAWVPSFFGEMYGGSQSGRAALGGMALSASSAGVCAGRILMGSLPQDKIPDRLLLAGCYGGGVTCFGLIVLLRPLYGVSLLLMFLSGAFISAQAPAMGSLAVAKFGRRAPVAIPIYEGVGMLAGFFGPPLVGYLADCYGDLATVLWLVPAAGMSLAAVALAWELIERAKRTDKSVSTAKSQQVQE